MPARLRIKLQTSNFELMTLNVYSDFMETTCLTCGAEMPFDARFCRRCGQQLTPADPGTVTDATTRLLDTPERPRVVFDTTPEAQPILRRGETQSFERMSTKALESAKPKNIWMITSMVLVVLLVTVTAVLLIGNRGSSTTVVTPPRVTRPEIPVPPAPPVPPGFGAGGASIDPSLVYPGAQTTMSVIQGDGNTVTQLHSTDDMGKVADWYANRLKPTKVVKMPESTVLEEDDLKVILTSTGSGTDIFLKRGDD